MKKIFFLIIFSIFITNNSLSEIFEMKNCYYKGKDKVWSEKEWLKTSTSMELLSIDPISGKRNYSKEKYIAHKDIILSIDTNSQMIFVTTINTRKYVEQGKISSDYFLNTRAGYEEKKRQQLSKKKQHIIKIKEIRLRPQIDDHDLLTKLNQGRKFLLDGAKLKVSLMFRGRGEQIPLFLWMNIKLSIILYMKRLIN